MAKKKISAVVKIQIPAGQATPAPPVGTALGPHGVAIMDFCKEYNAKTEDKRGQIVPVEITIFEDRTFTMALKTPPASFLIRQAAGLASASKNPGREVAGKISAAQLREIAEMKLPDLNTDDIDQAMLQIAGTARSMGVEVS
jgi:large subunit ribosomal protein L11